MFLHGKMNSRTHPLGPSLEAIGGGSDPLPATQRSAFTMRPNPSLAPPPTTTAPESTALSLCAAVGMNAFLRERRARAARSGAFPRFAPGAQRCAAPPCNTPSRRHGAVAGSSGHTHVTRLRLAAES